MSEAPEGLDASSLETATRRLIQEEDSTNTNYTSAEILDYINEGIRRLAATLGWPLAIFTATSVEDQSTYSIPGNIICLVDFYFDNEPLTVVDRSDLTGIDKSWLTADASKPRWAYRADRDKFGVYPKPDLDRAGKEMRIQAVKLSDTLVDSDDIPDLHVAFHDCVPYYAAFKCELKGGNNQRAADFLKIFKDYRDEMKGNLEKTSEQLMAFHFGGRNYDEPRTL